MECSTMSFGCLLCFSVFLTLWFTASTSQILPSLTTSDKTDKSLPTLRSLIPQDSGRPTPVVRRSRSISATSAAAQQSAAAEESKSCEIEIQTVQRIPGKCIKLSDKTPACYHEQYLDPGNTQCQD